MTLTDLLNMQRELQTHSAQQPESLEQIRLAQLAELGEIVQAVKWGVEDEHPAWAWWHRDSKVPAQRDALAGELADLLCFVLLELIYCCDKGKIIINEHDAWGHEWSQVEPYDDEPKFFVETYSEVTFGILHVGNSRRLERFIDLCSCLGFFKDEIEDAYKAAYNKNVARWQNA